MSLSQRLGLQPPPSQIENTAAGKVAALFCNLRVVSVDCKIRLLTSEGDSGDGLDIQSNVTDKFNYVRFARE